jgi:hypothetical protein
MWPTAIDQADTYADTFAGFLPTVRYLPAVALDQYLIVRIHKWYAEFLKIFVLVQGTYTLERVLVVFPCFTINVIDLAS